MNLRFVRLFVLSIFKSLLEKIQTFYFNTKYYNSSLKVTPPSRSYDMNNIPLLLEMEDKSTKRLALVKKFTTNVWKLENIGKKNIQELNKFTWISKLDIKNEKPLAKKIIEEWLKKNKNYNSVAWDHKVTSTRIIFWICCSHFTIRNDDMVFRTHVTNNIIKQALHLNKNLKFIHDEIDKIFTLAALILVSVTFEGSQKLFQTSVKNLSSELKKITDRNGFVETKNPEDQFWLLHHLILIREFLMFSQNTVPEFVDLNIDKVGTNYKSLLLSNNHLPLFNGAKERNCTEFNKFLKAKNLNFEKKHKAHNYLISKVKKYEIALDANDPPSDLYSQNYQAGCLSFEFFYNGIKIIGNSGSAKNFGDELSYLGQTTAAHSTLTINDTSSCLFQKNAMVRKYYGNSLVHKLKVYKKDLNTDKHTVSVIAGHNGYQKNYNALYERKILINDESSKVEGDELIIVAKKNMVFLNFSLRFHVPPNARLVQTHGGDILISIENQGWHFKSQHQNKIENSLNFASYDKIHESKCILVEGTLKDKVNNIHWSLEKSN